MLRPNQPLCHSMAEMFSAVSTENSCITTWLLPSLPGPSALESSASILDLRHVKLALHASMHAHDCAGVAGARVLERHLRHHLPGRKPWHDGGHEVCDHPEGPGRSKLRQGVPGARCRAPPKHLVPARWLSLLLPFQVLVLQQSMKPNCWRRIVSRLQ